MQKQILRLARTQTNQQKGKLRHPKVINISDTKILIKLSDYEINEQRHEHKINT